MAITSIINYQQALEGRGLPTDVARGAHLQSQGDYSLSILEFPPHSKQKPHYHHHGVIDIFIVVEGSATLHLAHHHGGEILPDSRESHQLRPGDTYALETQIVHYFETHDEAFKVMNIAQPQHALLARTSDSKVIDMTFVDAP